MRKQLFYCLAALCIIAAFVISCDSNPVHVHVSDDGTVTTEATCTTGGVKTYSCKECGAVMKTEKIPSLGHDFSDATVIEATCASEGSRKGKCSRCDSEINETIPVKEHSYVYENDYTQHWQKCSVCSSVTDKTDHTLTTTGTGATCTEPGEKTSSCSLCGYEKKENENALGHSWGEYKCDNSKHWKECTRSGCNEKTDVAAHTWDNGTVTTQPTCT